MWYVIVVIERRDLFETDEIVEKALQVINHNLIPIICLGESLDVRESGAELDFITKQLDAVFSQNIDVYKSVKFYLHMNLYGQLVRVKLPAQNKLKMFIDKLKKDWKTFFLIKIFQYCMVGPLNLKMQLSC